MTRPLPHHRKIVTCYRHEPGKLGKVAEQMSGRMTLYERHFSPLSTWMTGTRLFPQYSQDEAREYERKELERLEYLYESRPTREAGLRFW